MRTTIDLDPSVLDMVRERARRSGKSMGAYISEALAVALVADPSAKDDDYEWNGRPLGARIDLTDWEKLWEFLDSEHDIDY